MRTYFDAVFKNQNAKDRLFHAIETSSLSHAYIIEGEDGSGKMTLAMNIAAALSCEHKNDERYPLPCRMCRKCQNILSGNSPDVIITDNEGKATIGVDGIRKIKEDVYLSPTENDQKVYIIDNAQTMTVQAQNALLKVLEEPPDGVLLFLLTENSESLLTTVKSRAQTIRMQKFTMEEISAYLKKNYPPARELAEKSPDKFAALCEAGVGKIGAALDLLDSKKLGEIMAKRETVDAVIAAVSSRVKFSSLYDAFSLLSSKRNELFEQLSLISDALRDLIVIKHGTDAQLIYYYDKDTAKSISSSASQKRLFELYNLITASANAIDRSANIQTEITSLISLINNLS